MCLFLLKKWSLSAIQFASIGVTDALYIAMCLLRSTSRQAVLLGLDTSQHQEKHRIWINTEVDCRSWQVLHGKAISYAHGGGVSRVLGKDHCGFCRKTWKLLKCRFFFLWMNQRTGCRDLWELPSQHLVRPYGENGYGFVSCSECQMRLMCVLLGIIIFKMSHWVTKWQTSTSLGGVGGFEALVLDFSPPVI